MADEQELGLDQSGTYKFAPPATLKVGQAPIDFLRPQSAQHQFVLQYLLKRIRMSSRRMSQFYSRWQTNELKTQAYIHLRDYDALLKNLNDNGEAPNPVNITVPFAWSTLQTIQTYLLHMFAGRSPLFTIGATTGAAVNKARNIETLLQYNADYIKLVKQIYQFIYDGEQYGVAIMRTMWRKDVRVRTVLVPPTADQVMMSQYMGQQATGSRARQPYVSFEGNNVASIDPFMFLPDPRVPMTEVNTRGEFVFWRAYEPRHILLREQGQGRLKWVEAAPITMSRQAGENDSAQSVRAKRAGGQSNPGSERTSNNDQIAPSMQVDQGSVEIIPAELGLGGSTLPEKWIFTILNEGQIVQAEPLNLNHGKHPVEVAEPNTMGYSFGQLGTTDLLGPLQDIMSWFVNSHVYNVRSSLNNSLVVNPNFVEMQDVKRTEPGRVIRMKNVPFGGMNPDQVLKQLQVHDVTQGHMGDFQLFGRMASDLTGASDNVRGLQEPGGRKTATEVRTSGDAASSRLAAKGILYSVQAITGLAEQMTMNYQQFLDQEFEFRILGADGVGESVIVNPDTIDGDFYFPVHDGALPLDKVAMAEIWQQILTGIIQDPTGELRSNYSVPKIFEYTAQLGGAQNIRSFRINPQPDAQVNSDVQAGNAVDIRSIIQGFGGTGAIG